ncbi:hypothetical protein EJ05DRAFT_496753 [Pseudovirgaria hyperparasitica]|uniref:Trafficking protein particle complex II-specific subunit 65 IgD3 domain-containing protein n=1 Tax=Pseudovirgaria hyperparasitica TaxID=470096 RepID=A0A6A6WIC9_9PEZI|nr:uncharacterized protein EJ05DRAFT_496753 [Pseudovirgaria hyperparasitica]KAF2761865.1 hypothetical protein EJ05DRAFT_496753 [Pseudovirgaria hyperparasitica]
MDAQQQDHRISIGEFIESSILDTCVPAASSTDIQELLQGWDGHESDTSSALLPYIAERETLFFDEQVTVYVVLRTPYIEESLLKSYLSRLILTLECRVTSTAPPPKVQGEQVPPTKELLISETIKDSWEPLVIISKEHDLQKKGASAHMHLIWKADICLGHPRIRLSRPAIYFVVSASSRAVEPTESTDAEDEYMASLEPSPLNLLQAFSDNPSFGNTRPKLSAIRATKLSLTNPLSRELLRPIRNATRRLFKAAPAFIWRIRYTRWHSSTSVNAVVASLDIEATSFAGGHVTIKDVKIILTEGHVLPYPVIGFDKDTTQCKPGDQITMLFKLTSDASSRFTRSQEKIVCPLHLTINAEVLISNVCKPSVTVSWRTAVEFSADLIPDPGKSYTLERPVSQASVPRVESSGNTQLSSSNPGPDSLPNVEDNETFSGLHTLSDISMAVTVTGPQKIRMGESFKWDIFIVNKSETPRRLAVAAIPRRRKGDHKGHATNASSSSHKLDLNDAIADAIVDENVVYARQRNAKAEPVELICLSTDVRIGPLAPAACYNAEMSFLPLATGSLGVDALRFIDIASQEWADVRDLPSIMCYEQLATNV